MPGSIIHDKIAELAEIPDRISNEINRFIDDMDPPPNLKSIILREKYSYAVI
jgi:hypothetical protein